LNIYHRFGDIVGFRYFLAAKRSFFNVLKQIGAVFAGFVLEICSHLIVEANGNKKRG